MNRRDLLRSSIGVASLVALPYEALANDFMVGRTTTQQSLFDALPRPKPGQWIRLVLGSGVQYQKQIGAVSEATEHGDLLYYETQVGTPGGSCNPNTMKRTYLQGSKFSSLIDQTPVAAAVANSGTTLTRWADLQGGQTQARSDAKLELLDTPYLYDERPVSIVFTKRETLHLPAGSVYNGSGDESRGALHAQETTHTIAEYAAPYDAKHRLTRIELWTSPSVPFGVVKYRASVKDADPFELALYSYGTHFKTDLAMSLQTIRAVTPDGTYIQTS
jgi:hypothetical protein